MPDSEMGHGFDMMIFDQGQDYSGKVRCTVIRKPSGKPSKKGILYIHGFSDYFFQKEMALMFARHGYNFYAVDLRKYGRSLMEGQRRFEVRDLREYFDDIRAGLETMKRDGVDEIILVGHSTGGLTCALFMQTEPDAAIKALILNSPFLRWNLPSFKENVAIPAVAAAGKVLPKMHIASDGTDYYGATIAADREGEWHYRKEWKPDTLPDVDAAWVRAVEIAQKELEKGSVKVPVLLLHSDKSAFPGDPKEKFAQADAVLDVDKMVSAGRKLGRDVTDFTVYNGLHDVMLSRPDIRAVVYTEIFSWLKDQKL